MDKRAVLTILTFLALLLATTFAIAYNKGYRPNFKKTGPALEATGLLATNSTPNGAQVFIDGRLKTATNDTLNLPEGDYEVKIAKDGYLPWEKKLKIKSGVVTEAQARLFPAAPDLRAETTTGALSPTLSPDGTKLVYGVASGSAQNQGIWVMDLSDRPLLAQAQTRQIAQGLGQASFTWSPDSKQIVATLRETSFLLETDRQNPTPQNITATLNLLLTSWEKDKKTREAEILSRLDDNLLNETGKMKILAWSPDETRILYSASQSGTLPPILEKIPPGSSTQTEERNLKEGAIYVYDLKEDKNFFITEKMPLFSQDQRKEAASPSALAQIEALGLSQRVQPLRWFPDSRHLIWVVEGNISILEYDGTNRATIYSGPFENSFVYPWPNSSKLIILTTYNLTSNLYSISLK